MFWSGAYSQSEVARAYRIHTGRAAGIIKGRLWKSVPMPPESKERLDLLGARKGHRNHWSKYGIFDNDAFLMREMYCLAGMTAVKIAKLYRVTFPVVFNIVTGRSWKYIPFPPGGGPGMRTPRVKQRGRH